MSNGDWVMRIGITAAESAAAGLALGALLLVIRQVQIALGVKDHKKQEKPAYMSRSSF